MKIAVLRANALGDLVFALPALDALRARYPDAEITLLGRRLHEQVFAGRPGPVDRVVTLPYIPVVSPDGRGDAEEFFAAMRRERFDVAIQLHGGGRESNPVVNRLGAGMTVGLRSPDAEPLDRWVPYVYYQPEVARYLEVVALVEAGQGSLEPRLAVTDADRAAARAALPGGDPYLVLHPGASDPRRRWPAERFAAVGDAAAATGLRVVVTGVDAERDVTAAVVAAMRADAIDLAGKLSLRALIGLLAGAAVVVANDTGPVHLAAAVGAPTVGVYWCGNMINGAPLTRTRHRQAIAWTTHCPVCGADNVRGRCDHAVSFVAEVSAGEVIESVGSLVPPAQVPAAGR